MTDARTLQLTEAVASVVRQVQPPENAVFVVSDGCEIATLLDDMLIGFPVLLTTALIENDLVMAAPMDIHCAATWMRQFQRLWCDEWLHFSATSPEEVQHG